MCGHKYHIVKLLYYDAQRENLMSVIVAPRQQHDSKIGSSSAAVHINTIENAYRAECKFAFCSVVVVMLKNLSYHARTVL